MFFLFSEKNIWQVLKAVIVSHSHYYFQQAPKMDLRTVYCTADWLINEIISKKFRIIQTVVGPLLVKFLETLTCEFYLNRKDSL